MSNENDKIILDGKVLTKEEFILARKEIEKKKGVKLIEVNSGEYKTRIQG